MTQRNAIHPAFVRFWHWINVIAMVMMIGSGWRIYNASPLFDFRFPNAITLGGWLGGALQWHFAAMWLLMVNLLAYLVLGALLGHFRRSFLPVGPRSVLRDFGLALRFRLAHVSGTYNAVQRASYIFVLAAILLVILSGFAVWKPVQLQSITVLMGGYEGARLVHFSAMAAICAFVVVHLLLVILVPKTLLPMITGGRAKMRGESRHAQ